LKKGAPAAGVSAAGVSAAGVPSVLVGSIPVVVSVMARDYASRLGRSMSDRSHPRDATRIDQAG
jgi:hypothetical protein